MQNGSASNASLDAFVRRQIQSVQRVPTASAVDPTKCLRIAALATPSVAASAGVEVGDFVVTIDGRDASAIGTHPSREAASQRSWTFASARSRQEIRLAATGIDIGAMFAPTVESIVATFDPEVESPEALLVLWEVGAWELLEGLCQKVLKQSGGGMFSRLFGASKPKPPAQLLLGAARYEQGDRARGLGMIREFLEHAARYWTADCQSVGDHYLALDQEQRGAKADALELLHAAFRAHPSPRIAQAITRLEGRTPVAASRWRGEAFPVDYTLSVLESANGKISLGAALETLAPQQALVICSLANYRGNGPYNDFMHEYASQARFFAPHLPMLHVVTTEPERRPDRPTWWAGEDLVRQAGLPLAVLLDEDGEVTAALEPEGSPEIFVVRNDGQIVHHGELTSVDLWRVLDALTQR